MDRRLRRGWLRRRGGTFDAPCHDERELQLNFKATARLTSMSLCAPTIWAADWRAFGEGAVGGLDRGRDRVDQNCFLPPMVFTLNVECSNLCRLPFILTPLVIHGGGTTGHSFQWLSTNRSLQPCCRSFPSASGRVYRVKGEATDLPLVRQ